MTDDRTLDPPALSERLRSVVGTARYRITRRGDQVVGVEIWPTDEIGLPSEYHAFRLDQEKSFQKHQPEKEQDHG